MLFAQPLAPRGEPPQKVEEIVVRGRTEHEDFRAVQKTPIQKMREKLEKSANPRILQLDEFKSSSGVRTAQVAVGGRIFCIEERRGQIDFSGMGKGGLSMIPLTKPDCR